MPASWRTCWMFPRAPDVIMIQIGSKSSNALSVDAATSSWAFVQSSITSR